MGESRADLRPKRSAVVTHAESKLTKAVPLSRIKNDSPNTVSPKASANTSNRRGTAEGSETWKRIGYMAVRPSCESPRLRGARTSKRVVASPAVPFVRYCLPLGLSLLVCACLPSEPAPKGEKSKDNDSSFRPTDLSFKRPLPKPKAETEKTSHTPTAAPTPIAKSTPSDTWLTLPYTDHFDGPGLSSDWQATSTMWRIENGRLCAQQARNHPAWLRRRLPKNARISFVAQSDSPDGDLKVEVWGDGKSNATAVSYTNATSYLFILGGWKNRFNVLARLDEHGSDRLERRLNPSASEPRDRPVLPGAPYRFEIERTDGKTVRWSVNGAEMAKLTDSAPLVGVGHDHLGFNNWEVHTCFDDLTIVPLPD